MKYEHIYRWDLDKTYLETDFDSLGALVRTFLQKPADKENVPGSDRLIRALRRDSRGSAGIFFMSGSPKQMRAVLQEKLRLDGVYCEQIELKDNLRNLLRGRFRALKEQIGFKLPALLQARARLPATTTETLFGDDAERDAFVYSMYADLLAGRVSPHTLEKVLDLANFFPDTRQSIYDALDRLEFIDPVERIFIHLNRRSPPFQFEVYGARVTPVYNYLQAAIVLMNDGRLQPQSVWGLARHFSADHKYSVEAHVRSLRDLLRRRIIDLKTLQQLSNSNDEAMDTIFAHAMETLVASKYKDAPIRKSSKDFEIDYVDVLTREMRRRQRRGPFKI